MQMGAYDRLQAMIRDEIDSDGPVPGCMCEDCADETDFASWEAEVTPS